MAEYLSRNALLMETGIQLVFEDDDVRFEVSSSEQLVWLTWKHAVMGQQYRSVLMRLLDVIKEHGIKHWLSDGRLMGPILFADQEWSLNEYTPKLVKAGIDRIAIVSSADVLNQIAVDRMVTATEPVVPYRIAFFQAPDEARAWLNERPDSKAVGG